MFASDNVRSMNMDIENNASASLIDHSVYMSMLWYGGYLGAAYYDAETAQLHFMLETVETAPFNLVYNLLDELKPVVVITSAKQDAAFLDSLQSLKENQWQSSSLMSSDTSNSDSISGGSASSVLEGISRFSLEILSSVEFVYESGKKRILAVDMPGIPDHYSNVERAMYMSSLVPFSSISTIRAAGGLLRYLEKKRIGVMLENPSVATPILEFHVFTTKNLLSVDKLSYKALQIFRSVSHPSAYKARTREGLSLFGVLNQTITRHGFRLLKRWFYQPTQDMKVLKQRLDVVSFFTDSKNEEILTSIKASLKHIKNVAKIIAKVKTSKLNVQDWLNVLQTAQNALKIADVCYGLSNILGDQVPSVFKNILKCFGSDLAGIVTMITNHMDIDASKQENRFVVLPNVSDVVDEMKKTYSQLPSLLDKVAQQEIENYTEYLSACQIVYMRRIGYLLFVSKDVIIKATDASLQVPGMTFVASTADTAFYKTPATQKLDEEFGDILENIAYHEMEIMTQLQNTLLEHASVFLNVLKYTAELDCLISLAVVAKNYHYVRPTFVESKIINVKGSRHPLQEHAVSLFVPNDIQFSYDDGLIKILTGPNASGKSVYLKQVGLVVFMSYIGSFVPAESACIGKISSIYTIIRSPESLSNHLSTFSSDLNQMCTAINRADEHSIILMDEFGKGTATVDGVSLLVSCLTHFIKKEKPPLVLCTTHFHCIAQQNLSASNFVKLHGMDTVSDNSTNTVYLYQLVNVASKRSCACAVARIAGIPSEIVKRGQEIRKIMECNAPVYKFDRSSALTYQLRCNEVADYAAKFTLANSNQLKLLLSDVMSMLREKNTNQKSTDESASEF